MLDEGKIQQWLIEWGKTKHAIVLLPLAGQLLLEFVGLQFGLLDQALAKLALYVEPNSEIQPEMVRDIIGGWRTKTIWDLLEAACDGEAGEALLQLERLLQAGENPLALLAQMSWSLRRFAVATRFFQHAERQGKRLPLQVALEQAGFRKWPRDALQNAERQLKQLGRDRAGQMLRWLLEADLALKGSHSTPARARLVLETLIAKMAKRSA